MTRYHVFIDDIHGRVVYLDAPACVVEPCAVNAVHVFTDDDLGRDRHFKCDDGGPTGFDFLASHVAIPIDQYRRIFGEHDGR